ncbi:MAG: hypothetical protein HDR98_09800 [Bacteroides sp.]|nr:hypothetical protein [Bacteroides sp.]
MNKEIRFTGLTAVPSDYECPDGQLAQSLNLLNETGSLRPLLPPKVLLSLDAGSKIIFVHKTSSFTNYIIRSADNLYWISKTDPTDSLVVIGNDLLNPLGNYHGLIQVNSIGNTLLILCNDGMRYMLWKNTISDYIALGQSIPFPEINFALESQQISPQSFRVSFEVPEEIRTFVVDNWATPRSTSGPGGTGTVGYRPRYTSAALSALIDRASSAVYAGLNSYIAQAADDTMFTEPFFIRYALRLFDGSHVKHSAPILMIPNSAAPILPYTVIEDGSSGVFTADTEIIHARCSLFFQIINASLKDWEDIVTHIDFYISAPIYTYDQSGEVDPGHLNTSPEAEKFSHYGQAISSDGSTRAGDNHRHPSNPVADPEYSFPAGNYEHNVTIPSGMVWNVGNRTPSEIKDAITGIQSSLFYLVSSIEIGKIAAMDAFNPLDMEDKSLRNLQTRQRLEDDYHSHHGIIPSLSHVYNSRLNLAEINLRPFPGFPLTAMTQFTGFADAGSSASPSSVKIYLYMRRDGNNGWVCHSGNPRAIPAPLSETYFPRWLFYPDSSAVEMIIEEYHADSLKGYWRIPLFSHPSLEGACWLRGLGKEIPEFIPSGNPDKLPDTFLTAPLNSIIPQPNKIYTSEVNNPFFFPVTGINTVGTGRILGICSAAKALSQGQFGQFPLYAFTDEGVWALEVSSSGGYSAKQPITRDVCTSPDSITQIDSAVLFATDRGIMLISGSQTQCISDPLNSPDYFDFSSLPGLCAKFPEFRHPDCLFIDYIKNCRMAYDYVSQRIILFNPDKDYAYVYSMKTKLWGIQECSLTSVINYYPDALAMAKGEKKNYLVDLSHTDAETVCCLLVSRPLKFDSPDVMKTITTTIQRGMLPQRKEDIATILYGTRDYRNWHLVGSASGISLRTLRGTPYKAFRIVSVATLGKGDTISGCSFEVIPRLTNRLR